MIYLDYIHIENMGHLYVPVCLYNWNTSVWNGDPEHFENHRTYDVPSILSRYLGTSGHQIIQRNIPTSFEKPKYTNLDTHLFHYEI